MIDESYCTGFSLLLVSQETWKNFSVDEFILRLQTTELCKPADLTSFVDVLVECFNNIIIEVLDKIVPSRR